VSVSLNREGEDAILVVEDTGQGIDTEEFLRALRANPRYRDIPAIALTGFGREEDVMHARQAGFTAHLTKPIDFDNLIALACVAIERYRRN
jgi:two-component system CheB/CheR fusion protein